jgi:hypothetical protein
MKKSKTIVLNGAKLGVQCPKCGLWQQPAELEAGCVLCAAEKNEENEYVEEIHGNRH